MLKIGDVVRFPNTVWCDKKYNMGVIVLLHDMNDNRKCARVCPSFYLQFGYYLEDLELVTDDEIIVKWKLSNV